MIRNPDLEIRLRQRAQNSYDLEMTFRRPDSAARVDLPAGKATFQVDWQKAAEQFLDHEQYGRWLGESLLADEAASHLFTQAMTYAQINGTHLRVRLSLPPELHNLHWETIQLPATEMFVATNENTPFSRFLGSSDMRPVQLRPQAELRALVVIANPSDLSSMKPNGQTLAPIDVAGELERARAGLAGIELTTLAAPGEATLDNIKRHLRDDYDFVYLVCHGTLHKEEPYLWLETDSGVISRASGNEFAAIFSEIKQPPRLLFLASCESAGHGRDSNVDGRALAAVGPKIAAAGVPAVVAMQGYISMETHAAFMPIFFQELARDGAVDLALAAARAAVRKRPDWWMPVLYMRMENGQLRSEPAPAATPERELGQRHFFDSLPAHVVDRPEIIAQMNGLILAPDLPDATGPKRQTTLLRGMGGAGKSVLAQLFALQPEAEARFPDGMIWLDAGPKRTAHELLEKLGRALGDNFGAYHDVDAARASLRDHLADLNVLIVLDDVWTHQLANPFKDIVAESPASHLLITSRKKEIARLLDAQICEINMLSPEQAVKMLALWCGRPDPDFAKVAEKLGYLPLALKLAGAQIGDDETLTGARWLQYFNEVRFLRVEDSESRQDNLSRSIAVGVDALFKNETASAGSHDPRLLYYSLGIFEEDLAIAQGVIFRLWQRLFPAMTDGDCLRYVSRMSDLALIEKEVTFFQGRLAPDQAPAREVVESVRLHDILHDFNREQLLAQDKLLDIHRDLLSIYNPNLEQPWDQVLLAELASDGADDFIFYQLPYHMKEAQLTGPMRDLLLTAPSWLPEQRETRLESLVLSIWEYETDGGEADWRAFLKKWLKTGRVDETATYTNKCLAIQCAFQSRFEDIVAQGLYHDAAPVRDIAKVYAYQWYRRDKATGLKIYRDLSENISRFGVAQPTRVVTLVELAIYLATQEYRQTESGKISPEATEIGRIAIATLRRALFLNNRLLQTIVKPMRGQLAKIAVRLVERLLNRGGSEATTEGINEAQDSASNSVEYNYFFQKLAAPDAPARKILPYLFNRNHGDLLSEVTVAELAACWDGSIGDWFAAEYALVVHGVEDPDRALPIVRELFDQGQPAIDNWRFNMLDTWMHIMLVQSKIEPRWMDAAREMWSDYYDKLSADYGHIWTDVARKNRDRPYYTYFPLALYAQIHDRWNPSQPIDLVEKYLSRAEAQGDTELLRHILVGFEDPRNIYSNYGVLANHFFPYLASDDEEIRQITIRVLGLCRSRDPKTLDELIAQQVSNPMVVRQIKENSHTLSSYSLALSLAYFFLPFLSYGPVDRIAWLYDDLERIMSAAGLGPALGIIVEGFLNTLGSDS